MLPKKEENIYPKTEENIKAIITFYFDKYDVDQKDIMEKINGETSLSMNQIDFIMRKLSDAYLSIFKKHLKGNINLTNLFQYGIDALKNENINISGSKSRQFITGEFKEFVKQTK